MWLNLCHHGCDCLPNIVGFFLKDKIVCLVFNFSPKNYFFSMFTDIASEETLEKKQKQAVLSTSLNISRDKFIRTCMCVVSHKLSGVLFIFFCPGSVMEIFLCICTVHTYVRDCGCICTTYFSNRLVHSGVWYR